MRYTDPCMMALQTDQQLMTIHNSTTNNEMTFRYALSVLEEQFNATYRGSSTVKEMSTDLMSAISFEGEDPETIYHNFETQTGPNRIVKDDQVIKLATSYSK